MRVQTHRKDVPAALLPICICYSHLIRLSQSRRQSRHPRAHSKPVKGGTTASSRTRKSMRIPQLRSSTRLQAGCNLQDRCMWSTKKIFHEHDDSRGDSRVDMDCA